MSDSVAVHESSGNVFADLGIEHPEEYLAKSGLAARIQAALEARGLTQKAAGALMGISQPKVSALLRGHLDGFTTDRLLRFLLLLGSDIEIRVSSPLPDKIGRVCVTVARTTGRRFDHKPSGGISDSGTAPVSVERARGSFGDTIHKSRRRQPRRA
jgi:predicted XRE-type DNA-binding protein